MSKFFWLRDIHSCHILYVNPALVGWGRSSESLYADPLLLIENVHPDDRMQVIIARPIGFCVQMAGCAGSLRTYS